MSSGLFCLCLACGIPGAPSPAPPPGALVLLAREKVYQRAEGPERTLDGMVERTPSSGRAGGPSRFNAFRLRYQDTGGKVVVRELYIPGKAYLVSSHLGKKVRVCGKLIDSKADGKVHQELWPAWLIPLTDALAASPGDDGIFARGYWLPEEARIRGARRFILRSGEDLAKLMRVNGPSAAETATRMLAQRLKQPAIDWKKQMVVCVSAGLQTTIERLEIVRAREERGSLRIMYRLVKAGPGNLGFGYPAQTALIPRIEGEVRFEETAERTKNAPVPKPRFRRLHRGL
jgi:hypothetical protein